MITGELKSKVDSIWDTMWSGGISNPLSVIEQRLRPGGMLIVDNMFLGGGIFESSDRSASTAGVRELTSRINASQDWIGSIVPIRDGLLLAYRAP